MATSLVAEYFQGVDKFVSSWWYNGLVDRGWNCKFKKKMLLPQTLQRGWVRRGKGNWCRKVDGGEGTVRSLVGSSLNLATAMEKEDGGEGGDGDRGTARSTTRGNCYYIGKLSCFSYTDLRTTHPLLWLRTNVSFNDSAHVLSYLCMYVLSREAEENTLLQLRINYKFLRMTH